MRHLSLACMLFVVALIALPHPAGAQKTDSSPAPKAKDKQFELRSVGNNTIRFNVATGETWVTDINELEYEKVPEAGRLPVGDYDIVGGKNGMPFRIDRVMGTTWRLGADKTGAPEWIKIKEPK
jgi:hypothetical protein